MLMITQEETGIGSEAVVQVWRSALREEAHKRGLEAEAVTVMLTELREVPPAGAAGVLQVQDWLLLALSSQQR